MQLLGVACNLMNLPTLHLMNQASLLFERLRSLLLVFSNVFLPENLQPQHMLPAGCSLAVSMTAMTTSAMTPLSKLSQKPDHVLVVGKYQRCLRSGASFLNVYLLLLLLVFSLQGI
jgi:hypothetical protein